MLIGMPSAECIKLAQHAGPLQMWAIASALPGACSFVVSEIAAGNTQHKGMAVLELLSFLQGRTADPERLEALKR